MTTRAPSAQHSCSALLLEDWEDGDLRSTPNDGLSGIWHSYRDLDGTTLTPEEPFVPAHGGAHGSQYAGHIAGKLASRQHVNFGAYFTLSADWQEHCFEFDALTQTCCWGEPRPAVTAQKVFALSPGAWTRRAPTTTSGSMTFSCVAIEPPAKKARN